MRLFNKEIPETIFVIGITQGVYPDQVAVIIIGGNAFFRFYCHQVAADAIDGFNGLLDFVV